MGIFWKWMAVMVAARRGVRHSVQPGGQARPLPRPPCLSGWLREFHSSTFPSPSLGDGEPAAEARTSGPRSQAPHSGLTLQPCICLSSRRRAGEAAGWRPGAQLPRRPLAASPEQRIRARPTAPAGAFLRGPRGCLGRPAPGNHPALGKKKKKAREGEKQHH